MVANDWLNRIGVEGLSRISSCKRWSLPNFFFFSPSPTWKFFDFSLSTLQDLNLTLAVLNFNFLLTPTTSLPSTSNHGRRLLVSQLKSFPIGILDIRNEFAQEIWLCSPCTSLHLHQRIRVSYPCSYHHPSNLSVLHFCSSYLLGFSKSFKSDSVPFSQGADNFVLSPSLQLVKDGDTLSTAQKMVDGIVGFVLTVYAIITVFGFFGLCLGNIKATRLYMHAITSYLVSFGILGLVRIIVFATNKVSFTSSCTGSNDDCSKVSLEELSVWATMLSRSLTSPSCLTP